MPYKLRVMLSGVFEKSARHIGEWCLLIREGVDNQVVHPLIALLLDRGGAVGECFLHKLDHRSFRFVLVALGIFSGRRLQSHDRVRKEIICIRRVQELLRKTPLRRYWLEIVFVVWKVLRHRNQLAPDIVPAFQQSLRRTNRRLRRRVLLRRFLRACDGPKNPNGENYADNSRLHFGIPPKPQFPVETRLAASLARGRPRFYSSPALLSISRHCFFVRISIDCATSFPSRS